MARGFIGVRSSLAVGLAVALCLTGCAAAPKSGPAADNCTPMTVRTVHLADRGAPGGVRYAQVLTPPGVKQPQLLPVLYFLHGLPGAGNNVAVGRALPAFSKLFCAGAKPFLLVSPDGNSADHSDTEWADAADGRFDVESFLTGPLIAAVEGGHRRPRALRAIAGFSMGGFGAADLALRHPNLYGQFVSIAGYFTIDDPSGTFGRIPGAARDADRRAHDPLRLAAAARGLRVLLVQSGQDRETLDVGQDAELALALRTHGAAVQSLTLDLPHTYALVAGAIPDVAAFLETGWVARNPS
jgi:S-formylglutathione hydrolase FrmB